MSTSTEQLADHRKGPRRRGQELEHAILTAALDELTENGYPAVTMDRVASRARTSKAALYRRWPNRASLIMEAIRQRAAQHVVVPDTGSLRADMLGYVRSLRDVFDSLDGNVARAMLVELARDEELSAWVRERFRMVGPIEVERILTRAINRGEARPEVLTTRAATVANDLLRNEVLLQGSPISDEVITDIVDTVFLPLVLVCRSGMMCQCPCCAPPS